jgi:hypothetical protein
VDDGRDGALRLLRPGQRHLDVDGHGRPGGVVDAAAQLLDDHLDAACFVVARGDDFPRHVRRLRRRFAIDLAGEQGDELRPPLGPPHLGRRHGAAVLHQERVGQIRVGVRRGFVVVGVVRVARVRAVAAGAKLFDPEKPEQTRMVLCSRKRGRLSQRSRADPCGRQGGAERDPCPSHGVLPL